MADYSGYRSLVIATSLVVLGVVLADRPGGAYEEVKVENGGRVLGTAKLMGAGPPAQRLEVKRDTEICGKEPKVSEALAVSPGKGVKNVVVYLEGVKQGKGFSPAPVELDQRRCWFVPHVVLVPAGRPLTLVNSDDVLHNFRTPGSSVNPGLNKAQPKFKRRLPIQIDNPDIILVNCDIHEWMSAVIVVMAHPYYALTDENGSLTISDVPPGRYSLTFWHEVLGKQTREVVVPPGGEARVAVEFKGN